MDANGFLSAKQRLGLTRKAFARALGISETTALAYERGQPIPQTVAMAVQCLQNGLPPAK